MAQLPLNGIRCGRATGFIAVLALFLTSALALSAEDSATSLSLREIASRLGMRASWLESGKSMRLSSKWTQIDFTLHKTECLLNGQRLHFGFPVSSGKNSLLLNSSDWEQTLQPILTPVIFAPLPQIRHIILDPGHGGKDQGAQNAKIGLVEKSLTLDLAKRLRRKLQQVGYTVSMTREMDVFIPLEDRATLANESGADLFLSLHFNAAASDDVKGLETFIFTPPFQPSTARAKLHSSDRKTYPGNRHNSTNTLLGYYMHRSIEAKLTGPDRGLKRARFTVLRDLKIPGVLIEGGFLSHPEEGRNIGSAAYREKLCDAILEGLQTYERTRKRIAESNS